MRDAEAVTKRTSKRTSTSGGTNDGEMREVETDRTSGRTFTNNNIELVVLHGRIKNLLNRTTQTVDLVNKKNVAILKVGEDRGKITSTLNGRTRGDAKIGAKFMRDDVSHGGFTKTWRAI